MNKKILVFGDYGVNKNAFQKFSYDHFITIS